ncbi:hypothetical protein GF337_09665 [candidate division KSB1 bacterium]|nr:hypothetical protein [candidate division KSB1 bacterium]
MNRYHCIILFGQFFWLLLTPHILLSQETFPDTTDAIWDDSFYEAEIFEINRLKLDRLMWNNRELLSDSVFAGQLDEMKSQISDLITEDKYDQANILLESAMDLIMSIQEKYNADQALAGMGISEPENPPAVPPVQWTSEITIGSDLWQQEFEMAIVDYDSTLSEKTANPFSQLKVAVDWSRPLWDAGINGLVKNSRDYLATDLDARAERRFDEIAAVRLQNRFESTHYKREIDLTYWQNRISAEAELADLGPVSLDTENEFTIRKNTPQSSGYSDYYQYQFRTKGSYSGGNRLSLYADYQLEDRRHPSFYEKDYLEQQVGFSYFGLLSLKLNASFNTTYTYRDYRSALVDTSFYIDYEEIHSQINGFYRLGNRFAIRFRSDFEFRHHAMTTMYASNYLEIEAQPAVVFNFSDYSSIELGYVYTNRDYDLPSRSANIYFMEEDYYSHGISLSLDIFRLNRFMLNVTEIYSFKRYPNSAANDIDVFTLYTDRNINSLIGFFSWNISANWILSVFANWDDDHDPYQNYGDTRSTMLGLELSLNF